MSGALAGKRAFISGSSSGIGAATARLFAREGAKVFVHGRNPERTEAVAKEIGSESSWKTADLRDGAAADALIAAVHEQLGGVDILVNNAGGETAADGAIDWLSVTPEDFAAAYNANLISAVRMIRAFAPGMKERGWGRIIQISSGIAHYPTPNMPDYSAAKSAMNTTTESLAKALARTGVTVNTISPGLMLTPSVEGWLRGIAKKANWGDDLATIEKKATERIAANLVGRLGRAEDIANTVLFLAGEGASFINGEDIRVTGGHL
ncbi:MAG: SDR family oxidoreductase [Hyphomonadaceae bacterium]|nr:SDR family oxidoreductase [Hyphomonadaceae bacterium]